MESRSLLLTLAFGGLLLPGCTVDAPLATETVVLAVIAGAPHGGAPLNAEMTQEVTTTPAWEGDADGSGAARITVNSGQGQLCWDVKASDITLPAFASHIHRAPPGVRGAIVIPLSPPDANGVASGCSSGIDATLLREILQTPHAFYVNVHTRDYPGGAIRGQLTR